MTGIMTGVVMAVACACTAVVVALWVGAYMMRRREADNTENVMDRKLIHRAHLGMQAIDRLVGDRAASDFESIIRNDIVPFVQGTDDPSFNAVMDVQRGGTTERTNAVRTLVGARQRGDYSEALVTNPPWNGDIHLGTAVAKVWLAIQRYQAPRAQDTEAHQRNMRFTLARNLAQCIEDDGHRVCEVGLAERLVLVLQGYYPGIALDDTPAQVLSEMARRWADERGNRTPHPVEIEMFRRCATQTYAASFPGAANQENRATFARDLAAYLLHDYQTDVGGQDQRG